MYSIERSKKSYKELCKENKIINKELVEYQDFITRNVTKAENLVYGIITNFYILP